MVNESPGSQMLYVQNIVQKSFIEVNERGTEATTAAIVRYITGIYSDQLIEFVADHPFLFIVREDVTGVVLFSGHVLNPLLT